MVIPTTIVDNFLEYPQLWRDIALSCEYFPDPENKWPGLRSKALHEIDDVAFQQFSKRIFSIFYDLKSETINWRMNVYFQKMPSNIEGGWIHHDADVIAGVLYLTPNANPNSGTIFYRPKKVCTILHVDKKQQEISGTKKTTDIQKYKKENNDQFEETIRVNNVYNRLVLFDCNIPHTANINLGDEERLSMVFFVERINVRFTPIQRMERNL